MSRERIGTDFVRRPGSAWEVLADLVRVAGFASVVAAAIGWGPTDVAVLFLAASAALVLRMLGLRGGVDALTGAVILVAAWSGVLDLYAAIAWWDVAIHVVCTGVIVVVGMLVLARTGVVAHPSAESTPSFVAIALATTLGLALSALWEIVEWLGHNLVDEAIFVDYDDTIGDIVAGGAGAVLAGLLVATVRLERVSPDEDRAR
ncbi:hypothetical protein GCM10009846_03780 [Agrococcus versicolor]|uniref:DUF2238 domain-containing protein n=1 Tax=Agrococcus versicolor TaxID=501482 RepID=A0ABP5MA89_9MICO